MKIALSLFTVIFLLLNFSLSSLKENNSLHDSAAPALFSIENMSLVSSFVFEEEIEDNILELIDFSTKIELIKNEFGYQSISHKIFIFDYSLSLPCLFDLPPPSLT